jgi:hypothetical protein
MGESTWLVGGFGALSSKEGMVGIIWAMLVDNLRSLPGVDSINCWSAEMIDGIAWDSATRVMTSVPRPIATMSALKSLLTYGHTHHTIVIVHPYAMQARSGGGGRMEVVFGTVAVIPIMLRVSWQLRAVGIVVVSINVEPRKVSSLKVKRARGKDRTETRGKGQVH